MSTDLLAEAAPEVPSAPQVRKCVFRARDRSAAEQFQPLTAIHAGFAYNLTFSLSNSFHSPVDVGPVSVEQMSYGAFLERAPEFTYLASLILNPSGVVAAMQLDSAVVLTLLELLLGGQRTEDTEPRAITDIEEKVLERSMHLICQELQHAWEPFMKTDLRFEGRRQPSQWYLLMPPSESIVLFVFEIRLGNVRGALQLVFPVSVANALVRSVPEKMLARSRNMVSKYHDLLRQRLQDCPFQIELVLPHLRLPLRDVLALEVGRVVRLQHRVVAPAVLLVNGRAMFAAHPVASGNRRAAQIQQRAGIHGFSERSEA